MARKHLIGGLVAAGVLTLGIAAPTVAFAGDNETTAPSSNASENSNTDRAERQTAFAEALAKELGVPADKVTAALEKLREERKGDRPERGGWRGGDTADRQAALKERLAQAVKDGKLTQEQADAITAAAEAGVFPGGHWGGRPGR
ncbi:hypothetical protein GA0074692_0241 [Micromonospora pallida]|uniref:Uncharacterized protein n=1 Tax=Micromonospora pallida TaxID=145854 RepID=A0A1C6RL26_9ACTN|nr:hypothetical protein [Micromonospora pallida]SCL17734.1 hypothetical protein GA0074692_0241 [Micromonospora pallida]